eukprot:gene23190-39504_t
MPLRCAPRAAAVAAAAAPPFLGVGYDARDPAPVLARNPRIRERWQLIMRELRGAGGEGGAGLGVLPPLGHGAVALSLAAALPNAVVVSGEVEGPPVGDHL